MKALFSLCLIASSQAVSAATFHPSTPYPYLDGPGYVFWTGNSVFAEVYAPTGSFSDVRRGVGNAYLWLDQPLSYPTSYNVGDRYVLHGIIDSFPYYVETPQGLCEYDASQHLVVTLPLTVVGEWGVTEIGYGYPSDAPPAEGEICPPANLDFPAFPARDFDWTPFETGRGRWYAVNGARGYAPVPLPATALLLGAAVAGLAAVRRRAT